ncbi:MAG TPA: ZPR1 zinc finger domain-containing protein [Methanoregula sp.]|nr:ZPR1 zinc finger domain-containing protein [Methanoregula sp.]
MRTVVPGPCPSCNTEIEYIYQTENIPYFSDVLIISANCGSCGYRFVDTQMLKHCEPSRFELPVETSEDLAVRVVRSTSASIEIPELGVRIDPGPACEGFISNVEGVLGRIEQVLKGALKWGTDEERKNAEALLARIAAVKCGCDPITLILDDPNGNSAIVSEKATKECYVPEPECDPGTET